MAFTINNITAGSLVYQGVTIPSNNSYVVPDPGTAFAEDINLITDIVTGNVTITFNGITYADGTALVILRTLSTPSGMYNSTLPTLTTGQRGNMQLDSRSRQIIVPTTTSDTSGSGTLGSLNATIVATVNGCSTINFAVTGTWSASIAIQAQNGDGTWFTIPGTNTVDNTFFSLFAGNSPFVVNCGGYYQIRLLMYAYTSGTANVTWNASSGINLSADVIVHGNRAAGATDAGNPIKVGGKYNSALPTITDGQRGDMQLDSSSRQIISPLTNSSIVKAQVQDNSGNGITSQASSGQRALDVGVNVAGVQVDPRSIRALTSSDVVSGPTLTKGTQSASGYSVQSLKDAGRTHINLWANAAAAGTTTTETAITLTKSSGTSATTTGTSFTPTSGKRFRITSFTVGARGNTTATAQITTFNLRINTGGAVITSSTPIVLSASVATPATSFAWDRFSIPIPDGFEILGDGTLQFGITAAATYVTNAPTWFVTITGFEY